ncbi:MAG: 1-phosphofructokinase family hexose kinase [Candidatus Omnitrophica bacterium]|nr:1-phosphofructokinase family hexose kinase [Candidatus Omnitrophota bacterium]
MKKYVLTVTLNPAVDKTVKVADFKAGLDFRESGLAICAGGKGVNVSRVLKSLRVNTLATGFLGGTSGADIKQRLGKEGIPHNFSDISGQTRTSLTIIDPNYQKVTRILERGPKTNKKELAAFKRKFSLLLKRANFVVISGRNVCGAPDSFYADLIATATAKGVKVLFDTSGEPLKVGIKSKPFMIKPNWQEAEQLLGKKISSVREFKKAIPYFHDLGIGVVAITCGSQGAVCSDGDQIISAVPAKVKRKSPVGCGDAFVAGFVSSFMQGHNFARSVKMAVACGVANAVTINPGHIKKTSLQGFIKKISLKHEK